MFGYSVDEILHRPLDTLLPRRFVEAHHRHVEMFAQSEVSARRMGERRQIFGRRKDGREFPAEASITKAEVNGRLFFTVIVRDITDRQIAEEATRASLREKEVLLKEIHHRVKNNLQVVSSLLGLQSRAMADPEIRRMFQESQNRIHSMALIHERLYQSERLAAIDCPEYVRQLTAHLFRSYGVSTSRVRLVTDVDDIRLHIDAAVPCGLIINELVSNALKHAFPGGREGQVTVQLKQTDTGHSLLRVADNGTGLPSDVNLWSARSLGLRLVRTLAEQLTASAEVLCEGGTSVELLVPGAVVAGSGGLSDRGTKE
jgi:PAS domain S-box-containing protein